MNESNAIESGAIRVVIVDDHEVVALGIAALLDDELGIEVVATVGDPDLAHRVTAERRPDVVLMDHRLRASSGVDATRRLLSLPDPPAVVMITSNADRSALAKALDAGCTGFVSKNADRDDLIGAVRAAAVGAPYFTKDVLEHVDHVRRFDDPTDVELSDREIEVLQLTADGLGPEEIASSLFLSVHTVRNHLRHAMSKLDAHTKLAAVVKAVRARLISIDV